MENQALILGRIRCLSLVSQIPNPILPRFYAYNNIPSGKWLMHKNIFPTNNVGYFNIEGRTLEIYEAVIILPILHRFKTFNIPGGKCGYSRIYSQQ